MRTRFLLGVALSVLLGFLAHAEPPAQPTPTAPSAILLTNESGSYRLEKGAEKGSVVVVSTKDPKERKTLPFASTTSDQPECSVSPDEKWLLFDSQLYQRRGSVSFVRYQKKDWFSEKLQAFVEKEIKPPSRHWIWTLAEWSDDSSHLRLPLTWPDDGEATIALNTRTLEFERMP